MTEADCLVCREHRGDLEVPGGFLWEDDLVVAFHVPPLGDRADPYLGHLLVTTRRHVDQLGELTEEEAACVGVVAAKLARALRERHDATRVHCALIGGLATAHFHLHLLPRYPETPPDVRWNQVDEWEGARRGNARQIAELVGRLRAR